MKTGVHKLNTKNRLNCWYGVSYRTLRYGSNGYDVNLNYQRRSYTFERYKFWGDYNGFVPYVGPTLAYEALADTDGGNVQTFKAKKIGPWRHFRLRYSDCPGRNLAFTYQSALYPQPTIKRRGYKCNI